MYDLPSEFPEEPGLPDTYHDLQPQFLSETLRLQDYTEGEYFTASDLNIYYDPDNRLWHKRPDWFLAVGIPFLYGEQQDLRLSYVAWQEAVNPFIIVELISPGTEAEDLGETTAQPGGPPTKWTVYEQILQVPYYVVFNRYINELRVFKLEAGQYQRQALPNHRLWIPELKLGLGLWYGTYRPGTHQQSERRWLRWYGEDGQWLPTGEELARQQAEAEQQRANDVAAELAALKARLRAQGLNPDDFL
ncbi:Uma2 family endonuclease [Romeria aff. gracilis LEGE 07310]|uniref:Uma2 family endonuclease n=2 Tax=Vasconcelosia TaxID=3366328 RepID=A0A8J7B0J6_9CYAN|nr:Uma2 family endonuclease [Romeria aff. gracilis LEGE 07310]